MVVFADNRHNRHGRLRKNKMPHNQLGVSSFSSSSPSDSRALPCTARWKAPFLNGNMSFSLFRLLVPSGKIQSDTPLRFISSPTWCIIFTASLLFFRSTMTAPDKVTSLRERERFTMSNVSIMTRYRSVTGGLTILSEKRSPSELLLSHDHSSLREDPTKVKNIQETIKRTRDQAKIRSGQYLADSVTHL